MNATHSGILAVISLFVSGLTSFPTFAGNDTAVARFTDVGQFYSNDPSLSSASVATLEECARSCLDQPTCAAFTYSYPTRDKKCTLFPAGVKRLPTGDAYELYVLADPAEFGLTRAIQPHNGSAPMVDLMVLFTVEAYQSVGADRIQGRAAKFVQEANDAFADTAGYAPLRLIYVGETSFDPKLDHEAVPGTLWDIEIVADRQALPQGNIAAVRRIHELRDTFGADLVSVIVPRLSLTTGGNVCGIGDGADEGSANHGVKKLEPSIGFSLVSLDCNTPYRMAHELGHNFGLRHDWYSIRRKDDPLDPPGINFGYVDTEHSFQTLVTKPRLGVRMPLNALSDPSKLYKDLYPRGTAHANNAQAFLDNLPTVAAYLPERAWPVAVPRKLNFDNTRSATVHFYNLGTSALTNIQATIVNSSSNSSAQFSVVRDGRSDCLASNYALTSAHACSVNITFDSPDRLPSSGLLQFEFVERGAKRTVPVPLHGQVAGPSLGLTGSRLLGDVLDFGSIEHGASLDSQIVITNSGNERLLTVLPAITEGGSFFLVTYPNQSDCHQGAFWLEPGTSCAFSVRFTGVGTGEHEGELTISAQNYVPTVVRLVGYANGD